MASTRTVLKTKEESVKLQNHLDDSSEEDEDSSSEEEEDSSADENDVLPKAQHLLNGIKVVAPPQKVMTESDESDDSSDDEDLDLPKLVSHPDAETLTTGKLGNGEKVIMSETDTESETTDDESGESSDSSDSSDSTDNEKKNVLGLMDKQNPGIQQPAFNQKLHVDESDSEDNEESEEEDSSSEDELLTKEPLKPRIQRKVSTESESDDDYDSCDDGHIVDLPKQPIETPKPAPRTTVPLQNAFSAPGPSRVHRAPIHQLQQPPQNVLRKNDELLNAFQQFQRHLTDPEALRQELQRKSEEALRRDPLTFVCCVCFDNFYKSENFGKCKTLSGAKTKDEHFICVTCLRSAATPENAGIAQDGSGLKCPFPDCPNILLMSELRGLLDPNVEGNLLELIGRMSLAAADIGILVT